MDRLTKVKNLEKKIISEEAQIEDLEGEIITQEKHILKSENKIISISNIISNTLGKLSNIHIFRSNLIKRFNRHKVLYSFITLVSIVLIWTGLQTFIIKTPGISNPLIAIPAGLLIVWIIDRELA